jgi:excisionase family DNA binding protein
MNAEPWVSMEDVAKHVGVSKDKVHRWLRNRKMLAHKVGHIWKSKCSEVDVWVRTGKLAGKEAPNG